MSRKAGNDNSVDLDIGILSVHLWEDTNIPRKPPFPDPEGMVVGLHG